MQGLRLVASWRPVRFIHATLACAPAQGVDRLVLDVRNNGGGLFPAGVEVGRMLLDRGDIVLIADRCWVGGCDRRRSTAGRERPRLPAVAPRRPHSAFLPGPPGGAPPALCSDGVRDIYSAEGSALDATTPLVVLVNRGTASASEASQGGTQEGCVDGSLA